MGDKLLTQACVLNRKELMVLPPLFLVILDYIDKVKMNAIYQPSDINDKTSDIIFLILLLL